MYEIQKNYACIGACLCMCSWSGGCGSGYFDDARTPAEPLNVIEAEVAIPVPSEEVREVVNAFTQFQLDQKINISWTTLVL